jgi:hypothetical protein
MSPVATTPEEPVVPQGANEICDVLAQCDIWLALDFPNHESDPARSPAVAPPIVEEAP